MENTKIRNYFSVWRQDFRTYVLFQPTDNHGVFQENCREFRTLVP
jgi:hypothetical protein